MSRSGPDHVEPDRLFPLPLLALVSLSTALTLELIRSTGPLLEYAFDVGIETVAATAIATYLLPGIMLPGILWGTRRLDAPGTLLVGTILLAASRVVVQGLTMQARFFVGLITIALSIAVLTLAVSVLAARDGRAAATAVALGAAFAVGLQLLLGTWDAYWRHDLLGWVVTVGLVGALVAASLLARRQSTTAPPVVRVGALGLTLSLLMMVLANSGFAASQSDVRLAIAGPIAGGGLLIAGAAVSGNRARQVLSRRPLQPIIALAPAITITCVFWASGPAVLVVLVAAQFALIGALAATLRVSDTTGSGDARPLRTASWSASLVGLGTIVPLLVFQIDYDIPLGFPNELVVVAAALLAGSAVVLRRSPATLDEVPVAAPTGRPHVDRAVRALLVGATSVVVVGSAAAVGRAVANDPEPTATGDRLTLLSWNVHYGVSPEAGVDLEEVARSIEEQGPDIVTLQEVSRGWVLGGGTDMATWLAERLEMDVVFAPAADRQFGNAVLTDLPNANATVVELPYGEGPQNRSAISVDIEFAGETVRVTSIHLQNKKTTPTRLDQIEALLNAEADVTSLIVAGDFNAQPGWAEIERMLADGFVSAQDVSGDPSALTDPSIEPEKRIDWVFGRGVTFIQTEVLDDELSSDHLPLAVEFSVGQR